MNKSVHYGLTLSMAVELGFDSEDARTIAEANIEIDKNYKPEQNIKNYWRHFDPLAWLPLRHDSRESYADYHLRLAVETGKIFHLGMGLHSLQDKYAHGLIPFQKDLLILRRCIGNWRDDPKLNPKAYDETKAATCEYLKRFLQMKDAGVEG